MRALRLRIGDATAAGVLGLRNFLQWWVLLTILGVAGCSGNRPWIEEADSQLREMIESAGSLEAHVWMQDRRVTEEMIAIVRPVLEDLNRSGAQRLIIPLVQKSDGTLGCPLSVVIVLPADHDSRSRIFRIVAERQERTPTDRGQKYLYCAIAALHSQASLLR